MVCFQSSPRALGRRIDGVCGTGVYPLPDLPREASRSRSASQKSVQFGPDGAPFPETARVKVAHARLLATGETTTSFEPVPGLDLEHVVIRDFPLPAECVLVFWSCAAVALAWLVFFYKY